MLESVQAFLLSFRIDVLCSSSDWAFVMSEADVLEAENPSDCLCIALRRARVAEGRLYRLVAEELLRRGRRCAADASTSHEHCPAQPA